MRFRLYHYKDEPLSWACRLAFTHKNLDFENIVIDSLSTDEPGSVCLEIIPNNRESDWIKNGVSILEWLDDAFPESKMFLGSPLQKSHVRSLIQILQTQVHPFCQPENFAKLSDQKNKVMSFLRNQIKSGLQAYEDSISQTAQHFSVGDSLSATDAVLAPYLYHMSRFEIELSAFHKICRVYENIKTLECYKSTHPSNY